MKQLIQGPMEELRFKLVLKIEVGCHGNLGDEAPQGLIEEDDMIRLSTENGSVVE